VVAGRYELLDPIGHGAMGTVWRARDLRLDREVAVKEVCLPGPMTPQDRSVLRERSLREARVAARLTHPGVVTVHDVIEAEGGPWIIMELVPSRSLAQVLAEDGPLAPARAAAMGVMLLEALGSAHAAGVVHRDVKPGNILVTSEGRAVLTDFGIATLHGDPRLTQAGMVMGTPGFCAPERIRGEPASPASDLWSLGATLYAAVEGRGPFEGQGSAMAVLASIVHADPPPATRAGPLEPVILALMKRDPVARPNAAGARRLLTAACSSYREGIGANAGARALAAAGVSAAGISGAGVSAAGVSGAGVSAAGVFGARVSGAGVSGAGVSGAGVSGAGVSGAGVAGAGARDPGRADGGGNGATADGAPDEPGIAGGTRPAGGTLPLPAFLARDDAAFAGPPPAAAPAPTGTASPLPAHLSPAALVTASARAASGTAPASSAPLGPLNRSRRPGRHRRALLFGGRTR
jgi:eukaryotic-like serine/threonine-protein kinase